MKELDKSLSNKKVDKNPQKNPDPEPTDPVDRMNAIIKSIQDGDWS